MTHLASRPATETNCGQCGQPILTALDSGLRARVDPHPLSWGGEVAAILAGRWTYELTRGRDLIHRDEHRLRAPWPSGGRTVHGEHLC